MTRETCRRCGRAKARSRTQWVDISNPDAGHSRFCWFGHSHDATLECGDVTLIRLEYELATAKGRIEGLRAELTRMSESPVHPEWCRDEYREILAADDAAGGKRK